MTFQRLNSRIRKISVVNSGSLLFETGFRYEDRRVSAVAVYVNSGQLQHLVIIPEHLGRFEENLSLPMSSSNWRGKLRTITPDFIVSPFEETPHKWLDSLCEDYLTLNFVSGVSVSCPRQIESQKKFFWQLIGW